MGEAQNQAVREVTVRNKEGLHARPVMGFVDLASRFRAEIRVNNVTRDGDVVDGKSAMQMMLLEATKGNVLRIAACGEDAEEAANLLADLVESGFDPKFLAASD